MPDAIRASRRIPHCGRGIEPFLRFARLDTIRRLGRLNRTAPRNTTRADVREHGARLERIPYMIDKQYSSSAAASNGVSPTYGARQRRVIHHCKQRRLSARVRPCFDRTRRLHFGSFANSRVLSLVSWPISDIFLNARKNEDSCTRTAPVATKSWERTCSSARPCRRPPRTSKAGQGTV